MTKKITTGLIVGKFMPPHKGHEALWHFGAGLVDELVIVLDQMKDEPWSSVQRASWIKEVLPDPKIKVVPLQHLMPVEPSDTPDFYPIWKRVLEDIVNQQTGHKITHLIASMEYGVKLSNVLDCKFIEFDIARQSVPISATMIRHDPMRYWDYLIKPAQVALVHRLCLIGPESTGKSTMAKKMAEKFNTVQVPEYAKTLLTRTDGKLDYSDIETIAQCQKASEKALSYSANKILLCDTDLLTTKLWSLELFKKYPKWLDAEINSSNYDYLLFDPSTPYVNDIHRNLLKDAHSDEVRHSFFEKFKQLLDLHNKKYTIVQGNYEQKEEKIINHIENILAIKPAQKLKL